MIGIAFKDVSIRRSIARARKLVNPPTLLHKVIATWYIGQLDRIFYAEGAYKGHGKWKSLKPATVARREKMGKAGKILQVTGELKRSMRILENSPNRLRVGSSKIYAGVHNYGYKKIPKREYLFVTRGMEVELGRRVEAWMRRRMSWG